jgi:hypothetical protein
MAGSGFVVALAENLGFKLVMVRNVESVLVEDVVACSFAVRKGNLRATCRVIV